MQKQLVKLEEIADVFVGLPLQRYHDKDDAIRQKVIQNMPIDKIDEKFPIKEENISKKIKKQFYSQTHDILYKIQQQIFAKEITTEKNAIMSNNYIIIRPYKQKVNPTFLAYYLNNPRTRYEIERKIDSTRIIKVNTRILKELTIYLPPKKVQDIEAELIKKINKRIEFKKKSIQCDYQLINSIYDNIIGEDYEI